MFMIGLLGIAEALLFGIDTRIAAVAGAVLLILMWSTSLPPDNYLIYVLVLLGLAVVGAGNTLGLGRWWTQDQSGPSLPLAHLSWCIPRNAKQRLTLQLALREGEEMPPQLVRSVVIVGDMLRASDIKQR